MLSDFVSLFYPLTCVVCGNSLYRHETELCNRCYIDLPKSNFHFQQDNPLARLFYGRVAIHRAASYYLFHKSGSTQKLLHALKYKNKPEVGNVVGKWYGDELKHAPGFSDAELILPVPLHKNKLKKRGYNQSTAFAAGLSESLGIAYTAELLLRTADTSTQTKKGRFERWQNVENKFSVSNPDWLINKKVILVDDVVTTGATLEACAAELLKTQGVSVSIATIAFAQL